MARPQFSSVSTQRVPIGTPDDLIESVQWFNALLPATAHKELAKAQAQGSLRDPATIVDGKKGRDEEQVKPFGSIIYVESLGPIREAIAEAAAFVEAVAPQRSGWYRHALQWRVNGNDVFGVPSADKVGARGNVQLVDLAPYASALEIQIPRGIIYATFTHLSRFFGKRLAIAYGYADPNDFRGLKDKPGTRSARPYAVPVLTFGNPASTVKPGAKARPGVHARQIKRAERRAAALANPGSNLGPGRRWDT